VDKKRLQAVSHYCDYKKLAVFGQATRPGPDVKRTIKNLLIKTRPGKFTYSFFRRAAAFIIRFLPLGGILHARHYSNNRLGIFITLRCNLKCFNCQASTSLAPANDMMAVEQMEKFVSEAIALEYYWDNIFLTGGETTLHPRLFEIIDVLKRYKDFHPECRISLETNGAGEEVQPMLDKLPEWVLVINSMKKEGESSQAFASYNVAPCDTPEYMFFPCFSKGCFVLSRCYGLCVSMYGYYPCVQGMNVDRVFGFDIGIKKLGLVTEKALREQMKILCRYCGFFRELTGKLVFTTKISRSWREAFAQYHKRRPHLSRYG